jgi:multicomponent Na+:H+ antiporter subunit E
MLGGTIAAAMVVVLAASVVRERPAHHRGAVRGPAGLLVRALRRADPLFVVMGVLTAGVVTWPPRRITRASLQPDVRGALVGSVPVAIVRAVGFAIWMAGRIVVASLQIARIALSRELPIVPCSVRFRTELQRPLARTTLANAISLVPGTLTVDIDGDVLVVHALAPDQMDDLFTGRLQNKIAGVFLEGPQPVVDPATVQLDPLPGRSVDGTSEEGPPVNALVTVLAFVVGLLTVTAVIGVARGPSVLDRLLAASFGAVNSVVLLMLIGFLFDDLELFVDIGLSYALLAFLFPLAFARYLESREDHERRARCRSRRCCSLRAPASWS